MKYQVEVLIVVKDETGHEMDRIVALEKSCGGNDSLKYGLGLTIKDSKHLLETVQKNLIETEVKAISKQHANCQKCAKPLKRKGTRSIVYRTLFGKYKLNGDRLFACDDCEDQGGKSFSPLSDALSTHTHPELVYMQARWASLISYKQSLKLLQDVLPIAGAISLTNMKIKVPQVGQRIEAEREPREIALSKPEVAEATVAEEGADSAMMVGVDAGYINSNIAKNQGSRRFGVVAAKTVGAQSRCHAYVQSEVDNGSKRIMNFIEQVEEPLKSAVTFFTDAGADIKAATSPSGKTYRRILDWFHLAMYFQIVLLIATPFKQWQYTDKLTVVEEIKRIKWKFWHGQHKSAIERLWLLAAWIGLHPRSKRKDKLSKRLFKLFHYVDDNADYLVHYSQRKNDGLPISSAMAESAVNQVISHRFVKKQQMRWAPKSAHQLLQVRTAVLNDELADHFKRWYPGFSSNDSAYACAA